MFDGSLRSLSASVIGVDLVAQRSPWHVAKVLAVADETARAKTFRLAFDEPFVHVAGQHVVVRLVAPDGYTAQRSYSVASAPSTSPEFDVTVELLDGGEVSSFLHEVVEPGDELDVRGPLGGYFQWMADAPALLVGGGSGVVPLMSMLRHARNIGRPDLVQLVVSARTPGDLYYAGEIEGPATTVLYTREAPQGWARPVGRIIATDLAAMAAAGVTAYVCGSSGFVDVAGGLLLDLGLPSAQIRIERFGPSA